MENIVILLGFFLVLGAIVLFLRSKKKVNTVSKRDDATGIFSNTEIGNQLTAYLVEMHKEEAGGKTENLNELKKNPEPVIEEINRAYESAPIKAYHLRWAVVNLATMLENNSALSFFDRVIRADIPKEASKDLHRYSTVQKELMIRIRAVEGVKTLASSGDEDARKHLLDYVESTHFSIRKSAALSLLSLSNGAGYKERIARLIPSNENFIFDIKETKVEEAGIIKHPVAAVRSSAEKDHSSAPDISREVDSTKERRRERKGPPTL